MNNSTSKREASPFGLVEKTEHVGSPDPTAIGGGTGGALGHRAPGWMRAFNINPMGIAWKDWGQKSVVSHGSSEGHEMLKRNGKYHSIADDVPIPKM